MSRRNLLLTLLMLFQECNTSAFSQKHSDRNALFLPFERELTQFSQTDYEGVKKFNF